MSRGKKKNQSKTRVALMPPSNPQNALSSNPAAELVKEGLHDLVSLYDSGRRCYDQGNYSTALQLYNEALAMNPVDKLLRRERDKCRLILGKIVIPDFLDEPEDKTKMTHVQLLAYWRNQTKEQIQNAMKKGDEHFPMFIELAKSMKPTAEEITLGNAYQHLYGWGESLKEEELAAELLKTVINNSTGKVLAEAKYFLSIVWLYGDLARNPEEGILLLEHTAEMEPVDPNTRSRRSGVAEAQFAMGVYHFEGAYRNQPETSYQIASFWFDKARKNGHIPASAWIGYMYMNGIGVPKNEYLAECMLKDAVNTTRLVYKDAFILLMHLYIEQMETDMAYFYYRRSLETGDERIMEVAQRLKRILDVRHWDRKKFESQVQKHEKDYKNDVFSKHGICFRDKLYRTQHGHEFIEKAQTVYSNCQGKFSVQIGTFNEYVKKNKALEEFFVEMINQEYLEDIFLKSAVGSVHAKSILDLLLLYSKLLSLLGETQDNLIIFAGNREMAEMLLDTLYRVLEYEPFYLKWQTGHVQLLYRALQMVAAGNFETDEHFKRYLELGLGIIGAMVDPKGEGYEQLIKAWTFYGQETMPSRALAESYYKAGDFDRAHIVLQEGLERAPSHLNYLYMQGMACLRNQSDILMGEYDKKVKAISNFEKFLNESSKDHPKAPEMYYLLGKSYYEIFKLAKKPQFICVDLVKHFLILGSEAEKAQLKCFLPYQSSFRRFLQSVIENEHTQACQSPIHRDPDQEKLIKLVEQLVGQASLKKQEEEDELTALMETTSREAGMNFQIDNPEQEKPIILAFTHIAKEDERKNMVIEFRRKFKDAIYKNMGNVYVYHEVGGSFSHVPSSMFRGDKIISPTPINLEEMHNFGDRSYVNRILCMTVIDEPLQGAGLEYIHLIVEDATKEVMNVHIYGMSQDGNLQEQFGFGCSINVINPYVKEGRIIEIVDPSTVFTSANVEKKGVDLCRYCMSQNATKICSNCKWAAYCSKECQVNDWKILKHKWICQPNPFWNPSLSNETTKLENSATSGIV